MVATGNFECTLFPTHMVIQQLINLNHLLLLAYFPYPLCPAAHLDFFLILHISKIKLSSDFIS